jgi:hypothetical protein
MKNHDGYRQNQGDRIEDTKRMDGAMTDHAAATAVAD